MLDRNLFHSFEKFSVPSSGSAIFNNANDIANIFSRVTGSNISNVDGLIEAQGSANLFLLNPNGIVFGENASLNLGGSFFATTADSILFEQGIKFSATNPQAAPLLAVNIPIGFSFRNNPGDIVNKSDALQVPSEQSLSLLGGNITFDSGEVHAENGNIYLGGLSAAGRVNLIQDGSLIFPEDIARANVVLKFFSNVDASGSEGGNIAIYARNLTIEGDIDGTGNSLIQTGISENSIAVNANAGDLRINATDSITVEQSLIQNEVKTGANGNAGNIFIKSDSLTLKNGGEIVTSTFGNGNAGSIQVNTDDFTKIDGENIESKIPSGIISQINSEAVGEAGDIIIDTGSLSVMHGGQVAASTIGIGSAGSITIDADNSITVNGESSQNFVPSSISTQVDSEAVGDAGKLLINTGSLSVMNGGQVAASVRSGGVGAAGSINIIAKDSITVDGFKSNTSNITSTINSLGIGQAGDILIDSESLTLTNGGRIDASTLGKGNAASIRVSARNKITIDGSNKNDDASGIRSGVNVDAVGNSGNVTVNASFLELRDGGQIAASTLGDGNAGSVFLNVEDSILITGRGSKFPSGIVANALIEGGEGGKIDITTNRLDIKDGGTVQVGNVDQLESFGSGTEGFGNIFVQANSLSLDNQATIDAVTQSETGSNANINLKIDDITLKNNSSIAARAFANANGGNLSIDGDLIIAFAQNNDITANAERGNGGNINISTQAIFGLEERSSTPPNLTNDIDASSEFGLQGTFLLNTPDLDPTSSLIELPQVVGDASDQISENPCEQGVGSEFFNIGKGGLPPNPNQPLNSRQIEVDLVEPVFLEEYNNIVEVEQNKPESKNLPAKGWKFDDIGQVILTSSSTEEAKAKQSSIPTKESVCLED